MKTTADVVIIGGGCMGASTAYHLARRGITDVALIERETQLATGSTGRNAGGVRHQFSTAQNVRLSIESIRLLERFEDEVGHPIDFHQHGYLFLLSTPESVGTFRRNIEMQRSLGVDVDLLTPEDARRLAPGLTTEGILAASYCAQDGIADPNGITMGFAKAAQAAGVQIHRDTEVVGIDVASGRVTGVQTTRGAVATPIVVNAAGPHAKHIGAMVGLNVPVLPFRRHIFIARPPDGTGPDTGEGVQYPSTRIMVIDLDTTFYFHREGANILFGMGDPNEPSGFDMTVRWDFLDEVVRVAIGRLPVLADGAVTHAWAGLYEMSPDGNPIIGRARAVDGFLLVNGFSGHGFQHSPAAGRVLADLIVGRGPDIDLSAFAFDRFESGAVIAEANVV